uniref:Uncharacterized protein n=1 Tax=Myotis myotis TaxID=51298 RepID=A0A7J7XH46_MYOMY|nr:hypothetical protein mMyoMyo1_011584 [Myotis myotis]
MAQAGQEFLASDPKVTDSSMVNPPRRTRSWRGKAARDETGSRAAGHRPPPGIKTTTRQQDNNAQPLPSGEGPECTFPQRSTRGPGARGRMLLPQTEGNGGPSPVRAGITWPPGSACLEPPPGAPRPQPVRLHPLTTVSTRFVAGVQPAAPLQGCILLPRRIQLFPLWDGRWLFPSLVIPQNLGSSLRSP